MRLLDVLVSPGSFFRQTEEHGKPNLNYIVGMMILVAAWATVIFGLYQAKITSAIYQALLQNPYLSEAARQNLIDSLSTAKLISLSTVWVQGLLIPFFWIIGTAVMAAVSVLAGGSGDFRPLLRLTGIAYAPYLIFLAIALPLVVLLPVDFGPAGLTYARDPQDFLSALKDSKSAFEHSLLPLLVTRLNLFFQAWVYGLWVFALRSAEGFSRWKSAALVSGSVMFLYGASHLFGWFQ